MLTESKEQKTDTEVSGQMRQRVSCADMVRQYLASNGYEGLYNEDGDCACGLELLFPCGGEFIAECKPGYKLDGCTPQCGMGCKYHIESGVSQPLAYVGLACGRQYLKVAGVIVAIEGDICRDPMIPDEYRHPRPEHHLKWMPEMLEYAAKTINEMVG